MADDGKDEGLKEQIIKLAGKDVGEVYIIPPGQSLENPTELINQNAALQAKITELEKEKSSLSEQVEGLKKEKSELTEKLSAIKNSEVQKLAEDVVEKRMKLGLSSEDSKDEDVKKFSTMGFDALSTLQEDLDKMSDGDVESAGRKGQDKLSDRKSEEEKMSDLRERMFGHRDPLGAKKE